MDYYAIGEDKSLKNVNDVESWEKLWENPNPNSSFAEQTITLSKNLSQGDEITILTRLGVVSLRKLTQPIRNDFDLINMRMNTQTETLYIYTRSAYSYVGSNTMAFRDCYQNTLIKNGNDCPQTPIRDYTTRNDNLVPIAVYKRISQVFN